jgi:hypothetical protein
MAANGKSNTGLLPEHVLMAEMMVNGEGLVHANGRNLS